MDGFCGNRLVVECLEDIGGGYNLCLGVMWTGVGIVGGSGIVGDW